MAEKKWKEKKENFFFLECHWRKKRRIGKLSKREGRKKKMQWRKKEKKKEKGAMKKKEKKKKEK